MELFEKADVSVLGRRSPTTRIRGFSSELMQTCGEQKSAKRDRTVLYPQYSASDIRSKLSREPGLREDEINTQIIVPDKTVDLIFGLVESQFETCKGLPAALSIPKDVTTTLMV